MALQPIFNGVIADLEARPAMSEEEVLAEKLSMDVENFFSTDWISGGVLLCGCFYVYEVCEKTRGELLSALDGNERLVDAIEEELAGSGLCLGMTFSDEFRAMMPQS